MEDPQNSYLNILFDQFLNALLKNWPLDLVYFKEKPDPIHEYITEKPFYNKFCKTFQLECQNQKNPTQLIESFLDLLPYPEAIDVHIYIYNKLNNPTNLQIYTHKIL